MKKVLITGATGFIGQHAVPALLARGFAVEAVSRTAPAGAPTPGVRWHAADLLDDAQAAQVVARVRPTHLLHFAWFAVPGQYWTSPENLRWTGASLALIQSFIECRGRRVVVAGSCAEYDWQMGNCSESDTPLRPATLYGSCKHALHMALEALARERGLDVGWGRIFFLYGPFEHPHRLVSSVIRALLTGQPADCSSGTQIRDFLHVQDVADAFAALLDSSVTGAVNIGSGRPVTVKEVVQTIADQMGRSELVRLGARPADPVPALTADTRRLREELEWQPRYDLQTGLAQTISWWRAQLARESVRPVGS